MTKIGFVFLITLVLISGCIQAGDFQPPETSPGVIPSPGLNQSQVTPSMVDQPDRPTPGQSPISQFPTRTSLPTPSLSPTLLPVSAELAQGEMDPIQIQTPGESSVSTSPIPLQLFFPGNEFGNIIRVELFDESGKLLFREVIRRDLLPVMGKILERQIDFEIGKQEQEGILIVRLQDNPIQPMAINSVHLKLVSEGDSDIKTSDFQPPNIEITGPSVGKDVYGGKLVVIGISRINSLEPLKVQLETLDGKVISQRLASVQESVKGNERIFFTELTYQVSGKSDARLIVYHDQGPNSMITHLASLPLTLFP